VTGKNHSPRLAEIGGPLPDGRGVTVSNRRFEVWEMREWMNPENGVRSRLRSGFVDVARAWRREANLGPKNGFRGVVIGFDWVLNGFVCGSKCFVFCVELASFRKKTLLPVAACSERELSRVAEVGCERVDMVSTTVCMKGKARLSRKSDNNVCFVMLSGHQIVVIGCARDKVVALNH
jgi:hypothetical protein